MVLKCQQIRWNSQRVQQAVSWQNIEVLAHNRIGWLVEGQADSQTSGLVVIVVWYEKKNPNNFGLWDPEAPGSKPGLQADVESVGKSFLRSLTLRVWFLTSSSATRLYRLTSDSLLRAATHEERSGRQWLLSQPVGWPQLDQESCALPTKLPRPHTSWVLDC